MAAGAAVKGGFAENKIFSIMGGFEGEKNGNKESIYHGMRYYGGWRPEGLPSTYSMDQNLMYKPDIK
jgi:hypothetical protein